MIWFTKRFFITLFLCSCNTTLQVDTTYFDLWNQFLFSNNEINISEPTENLSFIRINYDGLKAIYVLSKIHPNNIEEWVGADSSKILTYKGLIIKTEGLENDFIIHDFTNQVLSIHPKMSYSNFISLNNPSLNFTNVNMQKLSESSSSECRQHIIYQRYFTALGYKSLLKFCFDDQNYAKSSMQNLEPGGKDYEITFHYRF